MDRAIPLVALWAVRPVQSLSACTRVHITFTFFYFRSPLAQCGHEQKCCEGITELVSTHKLAGRQYVNPLNAQLNPTCHLLALLAHHILHVSGVRVNIGIAPNFVLSFRRVRHVLGAIAKLQEMTITLVMSVCPSASPHGTTRLRQGGFSQHLIF